MNEQGDSRAIWRRTLKPVAIAICALTLLAAQRSPAAQNDAKPRIIPVSLNKGETYVISGYRGKAKIKVIRNANALAVQTNEAGKIVLVGSDNGLWKLNMTLDSGERVAYVITVHAAGPPQGSLMPGAAPTGIPSGPGAAPTAIP